MKIAIFITLLLIIFMTASQPAQATEGFIITGNDYVEMCDNPKETLIKAICNSYMQGLWVGLECYQKAIISVLLTPEIQTKLNSLPEASGEAELQKFENAHSFFCLPDGININQMNAIFLKYLK